MTPPCDLKTATVSPEAISLAEKLGMSESFHKLENLRQQAQRFQKVPLELRADISELKEDITEKIEQTHLEIDYAQAELVLDIAFQSELLRAYTQARDNRVNAVNTWSFRTNGVLWAVAEGLDIPTYNHPRLSIPSGTVGILAGLVPSVFSLVALHESNGGHYESKTRPNMLSKLFDYPTTAAIEYPDSVMNFLHSTPTEGTIQTCRLGYLIDRWEHDENIHSFTNRNSKEQLDQLTGFKESRLTIELVSDRLTMLQQISAVISQMNRPLLELMMAARGLKHF